MLTGATTRWWPFGFCAGGGADMTQAERRYQVFISSTYKDLVFEREAIIKAILQNYHFPIGMEMFHADDKEQWAQIAKTIDMSDFYVVVIGQCCGTLMKNKDISYTEKEYDYAISKNIPVLAFVIDPNARTVHFEENEKQRRVYKKFKKKVELLPRMTWSNKEELALNVVTTLHAKIAENKRNGWVPYNPSGLTVTQRLSSEVPGKYAAVYYSALSESERRFIRSELVIDSFGNATFYNNIDYKGSSDSEFLYHGVCEDAGAILYVHLKNDYSDERATMTLIKPVGNLERFIGLLAGCSVNNIPVCIKIACYKTDLTPKINHKQLTNILLQKNKQYADNSFIIEDNAKMLFYSDYIFV